MIEEIQKIIKDSHQSSSHYTPAPEPAPEKDIDTTTELKFPDKDLKLMEEFKSNSAETDSSDDSVELLEEFNCKTPEPDPSEDMLDMVEDFKSVIPALVWFLEHDPYTNVAMNLDVNS